MVCSRVSAALMYLLNRLYNEDMNFRLATKPTVHSGGVSRGWVCDQWGSRPCLFLLCVLFFTKVFISIIL